MIKKNNELKVIYTAYEYSDYMSEIVKIGNVRLKLLIHRREKGDTRFSVDIYQISDLGTSKLDLDKFDMKFHYDEYSISEKTDSTATLKKIMRETENFVYSIYK